MAKIRIPKFRTVAKKIIPNYKNFSENINELIVSGSNYPSISVTINDGDINVFSCRIERTKSCCGILEIYGLSTDLLNTEQNQELIALCLNYLAKKLIELRNTHPGTSEPGNVLRAGMFIINDVENSIFCNALDMLIDNDIELGKDEEVNWIFFNQILNPKTQNQVRIYHG